MDWLIEIFKPPILPAIFVVIGLVLQKKPAVAILSGAIKTMIGFMLLIFGMQIAIQTIVPLNDLLMEGFGVRSALLNSEMMGAALLADYGFEGFCVMFLAVAVNILLAKYSKVNGVYLTGHHLLYFSLLITVLFSTLTPWPSWAVIIIGGCCVGVYAGLIVKATQPFLKQVTGKEQVGFANSGNTGAIIGGLLGKIFKGGPKYESQKSSRFEIRDVVVLSTVVMFIYYLVFNVFAGTTTQGQWIFDSLIKAVSFAAAMSIVFLGMRMLLAEIIQIIYALHLKFAPDAVKGLDASAIISYSPNAWMAGFIISFITGIASMILMLVFGAEFTVIPGVASCFFAGGAAAVFANAYGGKRGVLVTSIVVGVVISLSSVWLLSSAQLVGSYGVAFGETEYGVWGSVIVWLAKLFGGS
jgi:PTS system ascorbate-specific IIC component